MKKRWKVRVLSLFVCLLGFCCAEEEWLFAKNTELKPFDQLAISKVACGPASALNTLRFSGSKWSNALKKYRQATDEETLRNVIFNLAGMRSQRGGGALWSEESMMSAESYVEMVNLLRGRSVFKKKVKRYSLETKPGSSTLKQLEVNLKQSLAKEIAPTLELVLMVKPDFSGIDIDKWLPLEGHLMVVIGVKVERDGLRLKVADSDGGRKYDIVVREELQEADNRRPKLAVDAPEFRLWKEQQEANSIHQITITGVIAAK